MPRIRCATIALLAILFAAPMHAAAAAETETVIVRVARPASPSPAAMQHLERRIAAAALEACGASGFSAPGVKDAVASSTCWRQAYADGMAQAAIPARADAVAINRPYARGRP